MDDGFVLRWLLLSWLAPAALIWMTGAPLASALLGGILALPVTLPLAALLAGITRAIRP
jgi:hypothetical protein